MDYTPEAWDADFEEFRKAVGQSVSKTTLLVCEKCDWIGDIDYTQDESAPICPKCGHPAHFEDNTIEPGFDDCPLDGDFDSCMESIGWGYDEQYGYYGDE